ncbi:hypothetical protein CKX93_02900 [Ectothiorhodosinus mongolicus]|nr:hypothetical protein CKX93_02900 [Ectothiorhodosinus mongolicus]
MLRDHKAMDFGATHGGMKQITTALEPNQFTGICYLGTGREPKWLKANFGSPGRQVAVRPRLAVANIIDLVWLSR